MQVVVSSRNVQVSDSLRSVAEAKIGKLSRYLDGMERAEVRFSEERNPRIAEREICEVTIEGHGHHVRARVAAHDPFVAVDKVVDKLENQLGKLKAKLNRRAVPRNGGRAAAVEAEETSGLRIVKTKQFAMKPMSPAEAALELDLLGHSFFFFHNADTGRAAVIYHRADGDLGLIDEAL